MSNVTMCISLPVFVFISRSSASKTRPDTVTLPEFSVIDAIDTTSLSFIFLPKSIISAHTTFPITEGFSFMLSSLSGLGLKLYTHTFFSFKYLVSVTSSTATFPNLDRICSVASFFITSLSSFTSSSRTLFCDFDTTKFAILSLSTVPFPELPKTVLNSIIYATSRIISHNQGTNAVPCTAVHTYLPHIHGRDEMRKSLMHQHCQRLN